MKKAIKYLMLALLIVPCTLVFAACGNKTLNLQQANQYRYEIYKKQAQASQPEEYQNIETTAKQVVKETYFAEVEYKDAAEDETTKTKDIEQKRETTYEYSLKRSGKGGAVVLTISVTKTVVETSPEIGADLVFTGKTSVKTDKDTATFYFGKTFVDGENKCMEYYYAKTESKVVVDGEEKSQSENEFKNKMAMVADSYLSNIKFQTERFELNWIYDLILEEEAGYEEFARTGTGANASLKLKRYDKFSGDLVSDTKTVEYKDYGLSKFTMEHTQKGIDGSEKVITATVESKVTTETASLPADKDDYKGTSISYIDLIDVINAFNNLKQL